MKYGLALVALLGASCSLAQDYPARPVTVVMTDSTGSASNVIARIVLERGNRNFLPAGAS